MSIYFLCLYKVISRNLCRKGIAAMYFIIYDKLKSVNLLLRKEYIKKLLSIMPVEIA